MCTAELQWVASHASFSEQFAHLVSSGGAGAHTLGNAEPCY